MDLVVAPRDYFFVLCQRKCDGTGSAPPGVEFCCPPTQQALVSVSVPVSLFLPLFPHPSRWLRRDPHPRLPRRGVFARAIGIGEFVIFRWKPHPEMIMTKLVAHREVEYSVGVTCSSALKNNSDR